MDVLKKELTSRDEKIGSLEERLLSVYILEHKIRALGSKSAKDIEKTVFEYSQKIGEIEKESRENLRREKEVTEIRESELKTHITELVRKNIQSNASNTTKAKLFNEILTDKDDKIQHNSLLLLQV